jgi:hypothetical protein
MRVLKDRTGKWDLIGRGSLICRIFGHKWGYAVNKVEKRIIGINEMNASVKIRTCRRCKAKERLFITFIY